MQIDVKIDDARLMTQLRRMMVAAAHPQTAMQEIAAYGESSTRLRFRTQTGPDGQKWKQLADSTLLRVMGPKARTKRGHTSAKAIRKLSARQILIDSGQMVGSASHRFGGNYAEWGVNKNVKKDGVNIAAVHQFGAQAGRGKKVTIPARPFLGISNDDRDEIMHILRKHFGGGTLAG